MDAFWGMVLIGGIVFYFLNKAGNAKVAEQQRQSRLVREDAVAKANLQKKKSEIEKPAAKVSTKKPAAAASKSRPPGWKPTYDGPMFAQPGEKSQLFSYASFTGMYEVDAPYSLIDFETSGFQIGF